MLQAPSIDSGEMLLERGLASSLKEGVISPSSPAQAAQVEQAGVNPVPFHGFSRVHNTSSLLPCKDRSVHLWGGFKKVKVKQFQGLACPLTLGFKQPSFGGLIQIMSLYLEKGQSGCPATLPVLPCWKWIA